MRRQLRLSGGGLCTLAHYRCLIRPAPGVWARGVGGRVWNLIQARSKFIPHFPISMTGRRNVTNPLLV